MMRRSAAGLAIGVLAVAAAGALALAGVTGGGKSDHGLEVRPDVVRIDTLSAFGDLERPPVAYPHDLHTEALQGEEAACITCHPLDQGRIDYSRFGLLEAVDKETATEAYHETCIRCHREKAGAGLESGPVTCGECHEKRPSLLSSMRPMPFDLSLHRTHTEAVEGGCGTCHHSYDEAKQALVYVKGEETSCRDCHRAKEEENRESLSAVSHQGCLGCHQSLGVPPTDCQGCHGPGGEKAAEEPEGTFRLERGQPDAVLLSASLREGPAGEMNTVPFDHKGHEQAAATCRNCHHETWKPCRDCHELRGGAKGRGVTLERAMHEVDSGRSCVGCHEEEKSAGECAGCHASMEKGLLSDAACKGCHRGPSPDRTGSGEPVLSRRPQAPADAFRPEDIPDEIRIDVLSDEYEPAHFPHRQVVATLVDSMKGNGLAAHFHSPQVMCQGCHHHGPDDGSIPRCGSCHGKPFSQLNLFMPGLLGAYHRQCIGCHEQMQVENVSDCTSCHEGK
ncbi:MAG: sulfate respiration complex hexadecaheme cytochrome HmcA [bacterium]